MTVPAVQRLGSLTIVFLAVLCWAYQSTLIKLTPAFDSAWTLWIIVAGSVVVYPVFLMANGQSPKGPKNLSTKIRCLMIIEPIVEVGGRVSVLYAMQNAPLGDAVTMWDLNVVWTAVLCALWDWKCLSLTRVVSISMALVGIILICQPDFIFHESHDQAVFPNISTGYAAAVCASVFLAIQFLLVSKLQEYEVHWTTLKFNFILAGVVFVPIFTWVFNGWTLPKNIASSDWGSVILIAVFDILAQIAMVHALQVENPVLVSLATTLEIPLSYLFAYLFSGEIPNYLSGIGAAMIFTVVLGTGIKDFMDARGDSTVPFDEESLSTHEKSPLLSGKKEWKEGGRNGDLEKGNKVPEEDSWILKIGDSKTGLVSASLKPNTGKEEALI